jgi:hypothetical protein
MTMMHSNEYDEESYFSEGSDPKDLTIVVPPGKLGVRFVKGSCPPEIAELDDSCKIKSQLHIGDKVTGAILPNGESLSDFTAYELLDMLKEFREWENRKLLISKSTRYSLPKRNQSEEPQGHFAYGNVHGHTEQEAPAPDLHNYVYDVDPEQPSKPPSGTSDRNDTCLSFPQGNKEIIIAIIVLSTLGLLFGLL